MAKSAKMTLNSCQTQVRPKFKKFCAHQKAKGHFHPNWGNFATFLHQSITDQCLGFSRGVTIKLGGGGVQGQGKGQLLMGIFVVSDYIRLTTCQSNNYKK